MKRVLIAVIPLLLVLAWLGSVSCDSRTDEPDEPTGTSRPHLPQTSVNKMPNPQVILEPDEDSERWTPLKGHRAFLDPGVSRSKGSGSIRLEAELAANGRCAYGSVNSPKVGIEAGKLYTYSAYLMSSTWPPPAVKFFYYLYFPKEDGTGFDQKQVGGSWFVPDDVMSWNESVGFFVAPPGAVQARVKVRLMRQPVDCSCSRPENWGRSVSRDCDCDLPDGWPLAPESWPSLPDGWPPVPEDWPPLPENWPDWPEGCECSLPADWPCSTPTGRGCAYSEDLCGFGFGRVWLDDFYFGEGLGFEQPPAPKTAFAGDRVRVDGLGNMEVLRDERWQSFFPLIIYPRNDAEQEHFQRYADGGFNVVHQINRTGRDFRTMRERTLEWAGLAANATSDLQPGGLLFSFSLDPQFSDDHDRALYNPDTMADLIAALRDEGLLDRVVLYNWDNEGFAYNTALDVAARVRREDPGAPIYSLNSREGLARMYHNELVQVIDLAGEYLGPDERSRGGVENLPTGLLVLDRLAGTRVPAFMMQLNGLTTEGDLRTRVYRGLMLGARGLSVYADHRPMTDPPVPEIQGTDWFAHLREIREEIDSLLPLLREPHFTDWTLEVEGGGSLVWGTRDYGGHGHVILANLNPTEVATATLRLHGLGYTPSSVVDYLTAEEVGKVEGGSFSITLQPQKTAVYALLAAR